MNGIVILMGILLLAMAVQMIMARSWLGLLVLAFVLAVIFAPYH